MQKMQNYIILALAVTIFGLVMFTVLHVPIKLCKGAGSIHLFKSTGTIKPEHVKLN